MIELLAPAGDMEKLKTALHFGADAIYFAGKSYGLRAMSSNFTEEQMKEAVELIHSKNKKAYVTLNVYARNNDFDNLKEYLQFLSSIKIDAVIVSDLGIFNFVKKYAKDIDIHVSTQANTTNKYSARAFKELGASRVVLARELSFEEIKEIIDYNKDLEFEAFVHGAMCISYSGRCLLSNYLTGRDSNHGECVQACRWQYVVNSEHMCENTGEPKTFISEVKRLDQKFEMQEDDKGVYIMNSKDLCLINYIDQIISAGMHSLKIEGRMKSPYYVATVVNTYKRAINHFLESMQRGKKYELPKELENELTKASHRAYTTGFMFKDGKIKQNIASAAQVQDSIFIAIVKEVQEGRILVEMRNRFKLGDTLEILSPSDCFLKTITVSDIEDIKGNKVDDAKNVCAQYWIKTDIKNISANDILRSCSKI